MNDLSILKPTIFASAPRIWNRIFDKIKDGISKAGGMKSFMANTGLNMKLAAVR